MHVSCPLRKLIPEGSLGTSLLNVYVFQVTVLAFGELDFKENFQLPIQEVFFGSTSIFISPSPSLSHVTVMEASPYCVLVIPFGEIVFRLSLIFIAGGGSI